MAERLKDLFNSPSVLEVLEKKQSDETLEEEIKEKLDDLVRELGEPGVSKDLNSLLVEQDLGRLVLEELGDAELREVVREAATLYLELAEFRVITVKQNMLEAADQAGTEVTSIFILFSSFSITVGILLIFLIFVMLAAERRNEMGMARAVGARRRPARHSPLGRCRAPGQRRDDHRAERDIFVLRRFVPTYHPLRAP